MSRLQLKLKKADKTTKLELGMAISPLRAQSLDPLIELDYAIKLIFALLDTAC